MSQPKNAHIYRSARQAAAFWLMFFVFLFIAGSSAAYAREVGAKVTWGILGVAICALALRGALTRVVGTSEGIRVRNLFGSFSLPWQAVERFEIGRWGLLGAVCLIRTGDGRTLHAFAIQENNLGESRSRLPAKTLIQQLNDELARESGPPSPGI